MTSELDPGEPDIEILRAHWREDRERVDEGRHCPDEAELFDAAANGLDADRRREIIAHTTRCGACAESWRVAAELQRARPNVRTLPRSSAARFAPVWGLAAAAALTLVIGISWLMPSGAPYLDGPPSGDVMRGDNAFGVRAITEDQARMPRQSLSLNWAPVDEAREYLVVVRDAEMNEVFADRVESPPLRIASEQLGGLEPGATLYWYVEAIPESGDRDRPRSETRTVILGD